MPLIPIKIPPGFYRNATQYQAKNRWYNGNLVRFSEGRLRPIGGWQRLAPTQIVKKGAVRELTITSGGTGYANSATGTLTATGGGGSSFSGTYTTSGSGVVNGVTITGTGADYTSVPTIVLSGSTSGTAAVITPTIHSGADPIRGLHSWRLSNGTRYLAIGSTQNLRIWDGSQSVGANAPLFDATPLSVPGGGVNFKDQDDFLISGLGYGSLEYGGDRNLDGSGGTASGGDVFGTPRYPAVDPDVTDPDAFRDNFASVWSLDNFGNDLIGVHSGEGTLWHWSIGAGGTVHKTFTASNSSGLLITSAAHGLSDADIVQVSTLGKLPTGLAVLTDYHVRDKTTDTFKLAAGAGGNAIAWTDAGSGTHRWDKKTNGAVAFDNATQTVSPPVPLANAPTSNVAVVVTPERHILVLGADGDHRLIKWAHQEGLTGTANWNPSLTNTAGDITLQTKGRIVGGFKTRYGVLIFTTSDVWRTNYLGPPYVYGVERLTEGGGPVGMKSVAGSADFVAWMSRGRFWSYTGGYIKELSSDCADYVFQDINMDVEGLICAGHNADFGEITWFYPKEGDSYNTRYITYSYREQHWVTGELERSAWESSDALGYPVAAGVDGYLYRHEMDPDTTATPIPRGETVTAPADVNALSGMTNRVVARGVSTDKHPNVATENHLCFAETGAIEIGEGNQMMSVRQIITDTDAGSNGLRMQTVIADTPDETGVTQGPFTLESDGYTDCRFTGRQAFLKIESPFDQEWRFGEVRFDAAVSGRR